ncbi:MAG TPA: cell division protein SepF [Streptosporangiaceae bacterium]|jgi:cell division inhibitor SepF|nr:cell division protein SepF [Streptosporangiaceae bacterium]
MAGTMHKMAVYLGLVEDDPRYDDGYDSYEEYEDEYGEQAEPAEQAEPEADRPVPRARSEFVMDPAPPAAPRASTHVPGPTHATDLARITTLHPRTYNEARTIGEHFREGTPVIMNLTEMVDSDAKRLVDFAAGLIFGLHGSIDRVTNRVFLLCPANVEVTAEDKARIAERGFFNQS